MMRDVNHFYENPKVITFDPSNKDVIDIHLYDSSIVMQQTTDQNLNATTLTAISRVLGTSSTNISEACSIRFTLANDGHSTSSSSSSSSSTSSTISRKIANVKNCLVVLAWPSTTPAHDLPAVNLRFLQQMKNNHIHRSELTGSSFSTRSLSIHADSCDISLTNIFVLEKLEAFIDVGGGDISFTNLNASNNAVINAHTNRGSVMVVMAQDVDLQFEQAEGAYCLGAPNMENVVACDGQDRVNQQHANVTSCKNGSARLGTDPDHVNTTTTKPIKLNVTSKTGAIYVVVRRNFSSMQSYSRIGMMNDTNNFQFRAGGMPKEGKLVLDDRTKRYVESLADDHLARPTSGLFVTFDMGNTIGSTVDKSKILYASRAELLLLEPWAFKFMSLGLVSPRSYEIPLRWKVPLACPANAAAFGVPRGVDYLDLNRMAKKLKEEILLSTATATSSTTTVEHTNSTKPPSASGVGVVAHKSASSGIVAQVGLVSSICIIHTVSLFDGEILFNSISGYDSAEILVVVLLSVFIALVVAIAAVKIAIVQLQRFVRSFLVEQTQRYAMGRLKRVVTSAAYSDPRFKDQYSRHLEKSKANDHNEDEAPPTEKPNSDGIMGGGDDEDAIHDDSGEDENDEYNLETHITYPFSIPEILSETYDRRHTKSLRKFLQLRTKTVNNTVGKLAAALGSGPRSEMVTLRVFQRLYHGYCFRNRFQPEPLDRNFDVLKEYGVALRCIFDHRTDAFLGIRFCTEKERRERIDVKPFPRESALSFFVRKLCVLSPFESDFVTFRGFARKYEIFTNHAMSANTRAVPVTKREMENLGVAWRRLTLRFIEARPFQRFSTDIDMSQVTLKSNNLNHQDQTLVTDNADNADNDSLLPKWFLPDVLIVFCHVIILNILVLPFLVLPLVAEAQAVSNNIVPPGIILNNIVQRDDTHLLNSVSLGFCFCFCFSSSFLSFYRYCIIFQIFSRNLHQLHLALSVNCITT